jgi:quercetin dioxygenase-like cupin family protein
MTAAFETTVLLRGEENAGEIAVVRNTVPAGWACPPLHRHAFDETFYVLDGDLTFQLGDELAAAGPGALAFAAGDAVHTLANRGDAAASYLRLCTLSTLRGARLFHDGQLEGAASTSRPSLIAHPTSRPRSARVLRTSAARCARAVRRVAAVREREPAPWTGDVVLAGLLSGARDELGEELWVGLDPWGCHLLHWSAG